MSRILHVVSALKEGGVEKLLANYYEFMETSKIHFDFITHSPGGLLEQHFRSLSAKIYPLSFRRKKPFRAAMEAFHVFRNGNYQIVHLHGGIEVIPELFMAWLAGARIRIVHSHRYIAAPGLGEKLIRLIGICFFRLFATHCFACSDQAGQWAFGKRLCNSKRYFKMNNAIQVDQYAYQPDLRLNLRRQLEVEDRLVIGHIGRFTSQKNHAYFIPVVHKLLEIRKDFVLLLIGDGELELAVRKAAEEVGVLPWIRFLGVCDNVPQLLQAMDIFVLPSIFEGLPVAGIEAQAAGLPCVFSDGITKETAISENVCFLSVSEPPEVWAQKIAEYAMLPRQPYAGTFPQEYDVASQAGKLTDFYLKAGNGF